MQRRHTTSSNPHPSAKESDRLPTFTKNEKNSFNAYSSRQSNKQRKMSKNVIVLIFSLAFLCFLFAPPDKNNNNNNEKVTFHHEVNNAVENLEGLEKTTPLNKSSTLNRLHQIKQKRTSEEASAAMKAQSSTFVDGEKLLKKELLKLQEHQKNGKYLGVKHLTNWEGPDVPIWDEGEDSGEEEEQDRGQNNSHEEVAESEHEDNHNNIINSVGTKEEEGEKKPQSIDIQSKIDPASMFARDMDKNSDGMHQQITALEGDKDISNEGEEEVNLDKNLKPVPLHDQIVKESQKENDEIEGDLLNLDEAEDLSAEVESFSSPMSIFDVSPPASIYVTPSYGAHRPNVDAVFALADGYDLNIYILFIHTLRSTGFDGDIVLQVSHMKEGVEEYLRSQTNLILYDTKWECRSRRDPSVVSEKANEGMNLCLANNLYQSSEPLKDPRDARPVATIRYELYWIWSTMYNDDSMLMLIDFRDAYFQLNPFESIERTPKDEIDDGGLLFLFGENENASLIRDSKWNSGWLTQAYKSEGRNYFSKPIICSGSTMGEKIALEAYLRAMVAQFDETKCLAKGCDQGFHNFLIHSGKLKNLHEIRESKYVKQGEGAINNLGALRQKTLKEHGILNNEDHVLNWDGSISPVVHQFDRDQQLNSIMKAQKKILVSTWKSKQ